MIESQELQWLDLGLLARVMCHELNNLIANQRGYTRLLGQRGSAGEDGRRWLGELASAGDGLQNLVAAVQDWSRRPPSAGHAGDLAEIWPAPPALRSQMQALRAAGCALDEVPLLRVLAIVAAEAGAAADAWGTPRRCAPPPEGAVLGSADQGREALCLGIADVSGGRAVAAWAASAGHILPAQGASALEWRRALALGLLRQSGGDLYLSTQRSQTRFELCLPLA